MNVFFDLQQLPAFKNAVITIGTFDGVHEGHKKILAQLKSEAKKVNGETVVITFHPHPRNIVGDVSGVSLLTSLKEKTQLLQEQQIDNLVVVSFTEEFANYSAEQYIQEFLYQKFHPHTIIIGYDHRFGKERQGDFLLLEKLAKQFNFRVKEINKEVIEEIAISSTRIRKALRKCNITIANKLLGYAYFFEGIVMEGDKLGRTIGYPTANLQITDEEKLVPADGVYAVLVYCETQSNKALKGMMYIGSRPVVNGKRRVIEVNIFYFDEEIYGKKLRVELIDFIRGDMQLKNFNELKVQLALDKVEVLKKLSN